METNNQQSTGNLFTQDGQLISAIMILEWLQADQVARSLLQGYLSARKLGVEFPQGQKNGDYSSLRLKMVDDYG